jgi:Tol biopolymer transport system component
LKVSIIHKWTLVLIATGLMAFGGVVGCEDDNPVDEGSLVSESITASAIIVNPKSPAPGDTIQLTVVITSDSGNEGDFPKIAWSATGGKFLESDQTSVRWESPDVSSLYDITCRVENSVSSSSTRTTVFVGSIVTLIDSDAGQIFPQAGGDFLYLRSNDVSEGLEVYKSVNGTPSDVTPGTELGKSITISTALTGAAYEVEPPPQQYVIEPVNVVYNDLVTGDRVEVTTDNSAPTSRRRQQYGEPSLSSSGQLLTFQGWRLSENVGDGDSLDVFLWDTSTESMAAVTETHGLDRRNWFPTISTDESWLTFISNRSGGGQWELYGMKLAGTSVVDTAMSALVRLTDTGGQIAAGSATDLTRPLMQWNPVNPVLALVTSNDALIQMTTNSQGANTVAVIGISGRVRELVWSPDGSQLAISNGVAIYTVTAGGDAAVLQHAGPVGDEIRDVGWSPDMSFMVFRTTRSGNSWFELLDTSSGLTVVLTPATSAAELGSYRKLMSLSPIWTANDELLLLLFNGITPGIHSLDISGALD